MHYECVVIGSRSLLVVANIDSERYLGYMRKKIHYDGCVMVQWVSV